MSSKKSKRKRILILARAIDLQSAGIHVYAKSLIINLDKFGDHEAFEYTILRADDHLKISLQNMKEVVMKNKFKLPFFQSFRLFFLVPYYAFRARFDVVIELAHFGPFNLPSKIKRVTVMHDLTPVLYSEFHSFTSSFLQKLFLPRILRKADLIISNSLNTQNDVLKVYPDITAKTSAIHLGVDNSFHTDNVKDRSALFKYGIEKKYILYLGTIEPRKNLTLLLKAFQIFNEKTKQDIQLVLAGQIGWKNEDFFSELKGSKFEKDIKLIGFVENEDLPTLYGNCEVFVYPSIYEGFGLPVVEALNSGAQVICANNSSLKEFGEELVSYFTTSDPDSLVHMLEEIIIHKKRKEIDYPRLKEKYSWKNYVIKIEKAIKQNLLLQL